MTVTADALERFSARQVHNIVRDLLTPHMAVYWLDFLASLGIGLLAFGVTGTQDAVPVKVVAFAVSVLALYRAAVFIHEVIHFRSRESFRNFRLAWNTLCGIPLLIPIFMYECHAEHHNKRWYGSPQDAEYLPLARMPPREIIRILTAVPILPFFGVLRFGILAPLAWLVPPLRTYVYTHASALKLDVEYTGRPPAKGQERRSWTIQEGACLLVLVAALAALVTGTLGWHWALQWYAVYAAIGLLNTLRLLGAHRYVGNEDEMSLVEQMLDTINYPRRRWLAELWAPVGLRLHALHHLLPGLPYHSFQRAHDRLMRELPVDSPYHAASARGLWPSIFSLWQTARHREQTSNLTLVQIVQASAPSE